MILQQVPESVCGQKLQLWGICEDELQLRMLKAPIRRFLDEGHCLAVVRNSIRAKGQDPSLSSQMYDPEKGDFEDFGGWQNFVILPTLGDLGPYLPSARPFWGIFGIIHKLVSWA